MLSQKTKLTNRKFYGKWLYKVTLKLPGVALFRLRPLKEIKDFCLSEDPPDNHRYSVWHRAYNNREIIYDICVFLENHDEKSFSKRLERDSIDFYSNDKDFYNNISTKFLEILEHRFEPDESTIDLLNQSNSCIAVKKLPKNRYNYRVYLLPHKMAHDLEGKKKYINWIKTQTPRITCTKAVENWFIKTEWNWDRRYVLVEDEATLLMLKLRNSEVVGRIYNFVISDK